MPNHLHGIIWIVDGNHNSTNSGSGEAMGFGQLDINLVLNPKITAQASSQPPHGTQPASLGAIIQNYKSVSTRKVNQITQTPGSKIWQRDYYERIIRDEAELQRIRRYIRDNPWHWEEDEARPYG